MTYIKYQGAGAGTSVLDDLQLLYGTDGVTYVFYGPRSKKHVEPVVGAALEALDAARGAVHRNAIAAVKAVAEG